MKTTTATADLDSIRATIRTPNGRITLDLPVHGDGPNEGRIVDAALTDAVRHLADDAGDQWPPRACTVGDDMGDDANGWVWSIIDADTEDTVGTVTVHAGAGA